MLEEGKPCLRVSRVSCSVPISPLISTSERYNGFNTAKALLPKKQFPGLCQTLAASELSRWDGGEQGASSTVPGSVT